MKSIKKVISILALNLFLFGATSYATGYICYSDPAMAYRYSITINGLQQPLTPGANIYSVPKYATSTVILSYNYFGDKTVKFTNIQAGDWISLDMSGPYIDPNQSAACNPNSDQFSTGGNVD